MNRYEFGGNAKDLLSIWVGSGQNEQKRLNFSARIRLKAMPRLHAWHWTKQRTKSRRTKDTVDRFEQQRNMVQFLVDDTRLTWVTDVKPLILFVFLLITCLGCGDDSVIQYPGAPVITIEKTAFDGWEAVESPVLPRRVNNWDNWLEKEAPHLHYRLKAEELLPYDIEVELSFKLTYYSDHLMEQHGGARDFMYQQRYDMKADRLTYEDSLAMYSIFHHTHTSSEDEIIIRRIRNIVIEILPWTGTGSEPYNVGSPSRIEIKRK